MKVTNNTSYNITLVNGDIIKGYNYVVIDNPNGDLLSQVKNLEKDGVVTIN